MPSPTFNGAAIFDSTDNANGTYSGGILLVGAYSPIIQPIHFSGEFGNRYLTHGYGDRTWTWRGIMSSDTQLGLASQISAIQSYIDLFAATPTQFWALTDNIGNSYPQAQIHQISEPQYQAASGNGTSTYYTAVLMVSGIISGMVHDG